MHKYILALFISMTAFSAPNYHADLFCAYDAAMKYKEIVKFEFQARDKFRHCTISCIVGIECGVTASAIMGMAKEIADVFGPGNAEWGDLVADIMGLRISKRQSVYNLDTCSQSCEYYY